MKKILFLLSLIIIFFFWSPGSGFAQNDFSKEKIAIECSNNYARSWWDVQHYNLSVDFTDTVHDSIFGINIITAKVVSTPNAMMQIDLDTTLSIQNILFKGKPLPFQKQGSSYFLVFDNEQLKGLSIGHTFSVKITYSGKPREAANPPWGEGGFVRKRDTDGKIWWAVTCQGGGAALWFPCKNFQGDEPDSGVTESYTVPASLEAIGNGRLLEEKELKHKRARTFTWEVVNPINNYDITFYIGNYVHWSDTFDGLNGKLDLNYYVLPKDLQKAQKHFSVVKEMLHCFETHFGPYPFYRDGYKLVQAPYLGMEHQSAIAYGNKFDEGYLGKDRSGTGIGLLFDFIIVHESAHEWFGNSITAYDKADDWIHEGFASYAETVFVECLAGKEKAFEYQRGKRRTILNDKPVEGKFNQCDEGSSDEYDKTGFMIHMIREILDNDTQFFGLLKAMNRNFYHQIVSGKRVEEFINTYTHHNFTKVFEQYLREAGLPVLVLQKQPSDTLIIYWKNCVQGFAMPVKWEQGKTTHWIFPTDKPKKVFAPGLKSADQISKDFLINVEVKDSF